MLGTNKQRDTTRKSAETTTSLLSQVNQLVTQGLRQAAIDLLEEAVSDSPNNRSLLSALGRVYMLDHQPDKAVIYLRRSLAQSSLNPVHKDDYAPDALTDADVDYIEELSEDSPINEFSLLDELDTEEPGRNDQREERSGTLHLKRRSGSRDDTQLPDGSESQITIIKRRRSKINDSVPIASSEPGNQPQFNKQISMSESDQTDSGIDVCLPELPEINAPSANLDDDINSSLESIPQSPEVPHQQKVQFRSTSDEKEQPESDDEGLESLEDPETAPEIVDVDDHFDDDLDEISPDIEPIEGIPLDDFESEDFGWEDLDDFDEEASRETDDDELTLTGIPREMRARQAAVDVLERVGWDREYLPLLESMFVESGWGAARIAIENQIERGAVPEQIVLARKVRSIWFSNEYLWTAFRMRSNAPFMQAEAVYKNFSWADALRLIRCFPSIPDEFEIEAFIEELFEEWYFNNRLRRHFHAFLKYLRYRIGASRRTLPGNLGFLFSCPLEEEWGVDNPELLSEISTMRGELRELGANSGFAMAGIENKFKVLPKDAFDEDKDKK